MVGGEPSATSGLPNFLVFSSFRSVLDSFFRCFLDSDSLADFSVVVDSFYFPSVLAYSLCSNWFYIPQSGNFWKHSLHIRYVSHALHLNPEFPEGAKSHSILWIGLSRNGFHRMGSAAWLMRIFPCQNPLKQTFHSFDVKVWISWAGCLSNQQRSESKNTCDSRRLLRLASNMFAAWKLVKLSMTGCFGNFCTLTCHRSGSRGGKRLSLDATLHNDLYHKSPTFQKVMKSWKPWKSWKSWKSFEDHFHSFTVAQPWPSANVEFRPWFNTDSFGHDWILWTWQFCRLFSYTFIMLYYL